MSTGAAHETVISSDETAEIVGGTDAYVWFPPIAIPIRTSDDEHTCIEKHSRCRMDKIPTSVGMHACSIGDFRPCNDRSVTSVKVGRPDGICPVSFYLLDARKNWGCDRSRRLRYGWLTLVVHYGITGHIYLGEERRPP